MNRKTILRKACLAAFAFGALSLSAQSTTYGVHEHDYPILDDLAHEYMTKYFGWQQTTKNNVKDYYNEKANIITPSEVAAGEVLLVEVNPYWRGV